MKWIRDIWRYEEGVLFWKKRPCRNVDILKPAGCLAKDKKGFVRCLIQYKGKLYKRSHLVFAYFNGRFPKKGFVIDHENRVSSDDRIENLRETTHSENNKNKKCLGAVPHKYISKQKRKTFKQGYTFVFIVRENGKNKTIKSSTNLEELIIYRRHYLKLYRPDLYKYL